METAAGQLQAYPAARHPAWVRAPPQLPAASPTTTSLGGRWTAGFGPIPAGNAEGPHPCTNPCTGPLVTSIKEALLRGSAHYRTLGCHVIPTNNIPQSSEKRAGLTG